MDEDNLLSAPLLKTSLRDIQAGQRTLQRRQSRPSSAQLEDKENYDNSRSQSKRRSNKYRRRSALLKRSIRRRSLDNTNSRDIRNTATGSNDVEDADTIYSEATERITNVDYDSKKGVDLQILPTDDEEEEQYPVSTLTKVKTAVVIITTIVAVGAYCVAFSESIVMAGGSVAVGVVGGYYNNLVVLGIAAGVCVLVTPVVWLNEWKLIRYPAMRRGVNALRQEANNLKREVNFLNMEINELQTEIESMEESNAKLQDITNVQDKNMENLVKLVTENQDILDEMREYLRQAVLQDIIKNILRSDEDRDGMLNKVEAKALEARLKLSLDAYGVVFDTEKFYRAIGLSPSLVNVISIVKRLLPDENNRVSSFYSIHSDDEYDSDDEDDDDEFDMFYIPVERETNCLCPDTLRLCQVYHEKMGRRPTLLSLAQHETLRNSMRRFRCEVGLIGCDCDD